MTSVLKRALAVLRGAERAPKDVRDMQLQFEAPVRARVAALAASHVYVADLMWSFPALIHALARGDVLACERADVLACARAGVPLRVTAERLGVPMWLKALPPEAFVGALPRVPKSANFSHRITNHLPKEPMDAARWLHFVAAADAAAGEVFALWAARQMPHVGTGAKPADMAALGVFAWFSEHPALEATTFMRRRFKPEMSLGQAQSEAFVWHERLQFPLLRSPYVLATMPVRFVDGFEFVQLETSSRIFKEAEHMSNCIVSYADTLARGTQQLWSVRMHGVSVATLHIGLECGDGRVRYPELVQLRARYNGNPSADVLHAVYRWLLAWPLLDDAMFKARARDAKPDEATYQRLMKPYWKAVGFTDAVPYRMIGDGFERMDDGVRGLSMMLNRRRRRRRRESIW